MSDANRMRLTSVREATLGTTPNTPRMRTARVTGEQIRFAPVFVNSNELRDDRMNSDPIKVNEQNNGAVPGELSYPVDNWPFSDWLESLFCSEWDNTPTFDNDGTADSVVTDAGTTTDTYVVASGGSAVVAGHLVRATGFSNSANNQIFRAASSTTTTIVGSSLSLSAETAPPAAAKLKVIGFQGTSGDIAAAADGLTSSSLDFTSLGLNIGGWIKIGGSAAGDKFATAACNGWARITAIAQNALTLDNLPTGWTTDAGTGKTLKVWFGDQLKNGVLTLGQTIERGFMGQQTPTYQVSRGMVAGQGEFGFVSEQIATTSITFTGMTGAQGAVTLDASPDAATMNPVMAAAVNVGRIAENGTAVGGPNYIRSARFTIQNNLRPIGGIRSDGLVGPEDIGKGSVDVGVALETYFGSNSLLSKLFSGVATNINVRIAKDSQAMIWGVPRLTYTDGAANATAKNTDAMLPLTGQASKDTLTSAHIILDRLEYFEA
ncbi:phage tail tube protein [Mesorhizobium sp. YM1C-6-2]|uniref:phage tail tube protein n=1 Tax=Mesorhizobium sp. YM1C-6-2 TaxID=1827501 RepID=UPI000EF206BF|nr:phage tail tube protein [Mesorhizobium sp. YM1C-6-2]RLP22266.1 hypothetical protein D8676_25335 [Mesorhizobium sp. YM1C-6-2]